MGQFKNFASHAFCILLAIYFLFLVLLVNIYCIFSLTTSMAINFALVSGILN